MKWARRFTLLLIGVLLFTVLPSAIVFADSPEVTRAKVFEDYQEDGDWLIVVAYNCSEAPYYDYYPSVEYWNIQLLDSSNNVLAQNPMQQWELRPGSIYLSADSASALEWNGDYTIRIQANYNASLNGSYALTSTDWIGNAFSQLDSQCLSIAREMEDYDSPTTPYISDTVYGPMLSLQAGMYFDIGIPELSTVRPNLFEVHITELDEWEDTEWTHDYSNELDDWETSVGPELADAFNDAGDLIDMDGRYIGGLLVFIGFIALAALAVTLGHFAAGATLASLSIFGGVIVGLIPMAAVFVVIALLALMFVIKFWFGAT